MIKNTIWILILLGLTLPNAYAQKSRVLVIGDSQSQRSLGPALFDALNEKYDVHSYSVCGASARTYSVATEVESLRAMCGVKSENDPIVHRHSADTAHPSLTTEEIVKGPGMLESALKQHIPELVIIQLGDNMADGYTGEINEQFVAEQVKAITEKLALLAPNVPECRWAAPVFGESKADQVPGWDKKDEQVKAINDAIAKGLAESGVKCTLIRGDDADLKASLGTDSTVDGLHLSDAAASVWAENIMSQLPTLGAEATGSRPCPREVIGPLSSEVESLMSDIQNVTGSLDDTSGYTPPDTASVRRQQETDQMFSTGYNYGPASNVEKGLLPQAKSSGGGFFSGLGSFFSGLFKGIGQFFSSIFNGLTGLFTGRSATTPIPPVDIPVNKTVSTDPLDRHSSLLTSYSDDASEVERSPAAQAIEDITVNNVPGSTPLELQLERAGTEMERPKMIGGFRYDSRFDTPPSPDTLERPDSYTPSAAPENERLAVDPTLSDEDRLLAEGKRLGADSWRRLNTLTRDAFNSGGERSCRAKLDDAYDEIDGGAIWGNLSLEQRADRIRTHADIALRKMKETSSSEATASQRGSPHNLHPLLDGSVGVCISFIETRGTLNPHAMNYTMCQPRVSGKWSTASGLGQMTRTTFNGLHRQGLLPVTTTDDYEGKTRDELFYAITDDVNLQMEVLLRYMNYEIKRTAGRGGSDEEILLRAVAAYDQDNQSRYVRMFGRCHRCMKSLQSNQDPMHCYREMGR